MKTVDELILNSLGIAYKLEAITVGIKAKNGDKKAIPEFRKKLETLLTPTEGGKDD